ncbi:MAG: DUF3311 domain-containing protein [Actinobacteria bacterium]|jgi:hypothetical protein|nr:DUF3311 domain-containing protein [Actinomycetota bacterium]
MTTKERFNQQSGRSYVASKLSLAIGLGVPVVAIMVVLPILSGSKMTIAGLPFVYFWLFLWFPLTSVCLFLSWWISDRHHFGTVAKDVEEGR